MKNLRNQFIELLNIHGTSGNENPVRDYLKPILTELMDNVKVDDYGNLLADKKCGDGNGATVLLSAHMDTVKGVLADRELIETEDGIIMSNKGALGADDRGGIAIILTVLRNLDKLNFNGHIKVSFSREEEIGCVGASKIDPDWYANDTDLAIVVDRRGNRDIVVGCGMAFCSDSVGYFMEDVSKMADMDWKAVEGGVSDAMVFAEHGVNSINLSAGYMNEHTVNEYASLKDMRDTVRLILQTIAVINQFYKTFEAVPRENKWVKSWYHKGNYNYYEDVFEEEHVWAEEADLNGDVYVYDVGADIVIQQGNQEIILSRESMKSLIKQLNGAI